MQYHAFVIKYAEIGIKGKNRYIFEEALVKQMERVLEKCEGEFSIFRVSGRRAALCSSRCSKAAVFSFRFC